jgi:hypothetical protein
MTSIADDVVIIQTSSESVPSTPSWFGEVVLIATHLRKHGILSKISEGVRFARRRFGHYEVIDFLAVLIGYAISGERTLERPDWLNQPPLGNIGSKEPKFLLIHRRKKGRHLVKKFLERQKLVEASHILSLYSVKGILPRLVWESPRWLILTVPSFLTKRADVVTVFSDYFLSVEAQTSCSAS